jgi:hypothetical protein
MNYSQTLDALLGWIGSPVRATVHDTEANPLLVLNGDLGRAPDSSETADEARFFCVGHDDPRHGADGFFVPEATFKHSGYIDGPWPGQERTVLVISLEGSSLVIERGPVHGRSSI